MSVEAAGLRESYRACASIARREAKNFYWSFLLLPPERRRAMCALYAFMRETDDIADEPGPAGPKREALERWRDDLRAVLEGEPVASPILPALADTVARRSVPSRYLHDVIDGVEMDLDPRPIATEAELDAYCDRVASAVGLSCIHIWGYRSEGGRAEAMAVACGRALQLTNILRDVKEDARNGRVYLPTEHLRRFGVAPSELASDRLEGSGRVRRLLEFEAARAAELYRAGAGLVGLVEPIGRPVLRAIVRIYRALLSAIEARGFDVFSGRVAVPSWRKAAIALGSLAGGRP